MLPSLRSFTWWTSRCSARWWIYPTHQREPNNQSSGCLRPTRYNFLLPRPETNNSLPKIGLPFETQEERLVSQPRFLDIFPELSFRLCHHSFSSWWSLGVRYPFPPCTSCTHNQGCCWRMNHIKPGLIPSSYFLFWVVYSSTSGKNMHT